MDEDEQQTNVPETVNEDRCDAALLWPIRVIVSSIPIFHSFSVLLEENLAKRRLNRLEQFANALRERIEKNQASYDQLSETVLEFAATKAAEHTEKWKPRVLANIASFNAADDNDDSHSHLFKLILIDHTSQLTDFDLATFIDKIPDHPPVFPEDIRDGIIELEKTRPEILELKQISLNKLTRLGFLSHPASNSDQYYDITEIGRSLVGVLA